VLIISLQTADPQFKRLENGIISGPQGAIPLHIYPPGDATQNPPPIFVHFHGSGWDAMCATMPPANLPRERIASWSRKISNYH